MLQPFRTHVFLSVDAAKQVVANHLVTHHVTHLAEATILADLHVVHRAVARQYTQPQAAHHHATQAAVVLRMQHQYQAAVAQATQLQFTAHVALAVVQAVATHVEQLLVVANHVVLVAAAHHVAILRAGIHLAVLRVVTHLVVLHAEQAVDAKHQLAANHVAVLAYSAVAVNQLRPNRN